MRDEIISLVRRPSRYLGSEINSIHKDHSKIRTKIALAFPDLYEIGMSHLGLKILYHILNSRPDILAERVFSPGIDYEDILLDKDYPLCSLESYIPLNRFDIVGFTLQHEMSYTNILNILSLGKIPLRSKQRDDDFPLIIGGGPCAFNPEPLADFFDLFVIGDGEEVIIEIIDTYQECRGKGRKKEEILEEMTGIKGVYIPSLFEIDYNRDGTISKIRSLKEGYKVEKRTVYDLNSVDYPTSPLVPYTKLIHDRISAEIDRGCTQGCRFCHAGSIYRPVRERNEEKIIEILEESIKNTGYEEFSFTSLSSGDHSCLGGLIPKLMRRFAPYKTALSLPSLRPGTITPELIREIKKVRKTGFTITVEAGSQRLRDVINKKITEDDILKAITDIARGGWKSLKLYFMIGLPTETEEDIEDIYKLCVKILRAAEIKGGRIRNINIGISSFVPKSNTPFQWFPLNHIDTLKHKQSYLMRRFRNNRKISLKWQKGEISLIEAVFARGNRRLVDTLEKALYLGCKFDNWGEHFNYKKWVRAFNDSNIDPGFHTTRNRSFEEILPWDHISIGIDKEFLVSEYKRGVNGELTPDCRNGDCNGCGLMTSCEKLLDRGEKNISSRYPLKLEARSSIDIQQPPISYQRIRLQYEKREDMRFLSHLELNKAIYRACRRAVIPLAYTQGHHPHPRISFGFALPVGMESKAEYADIQLRGHMGIEKIVNDLNLHLMKGLKILSAREIPLNYRSISVMTDKIIYSIKLFDIAPKGIDIANFLSGDRIIVRDGRSKEVNIRPLIDDIKVIGIKDDYIELELILKIEDDRNIKPIDVLKNLCPPGYESLSSALITKIGLCWKMD